MSQSTLISPYGPEGLWQEVPANDGLARVINGPTIASGAFLSFATLVTGVAPAQAMTAAQLASLVRGQPVWIASLGVDFFWDPASIDTPDNISVINPTANGANPGRLLRDTAPATHWQLQASWSVDATNGLDENTGTADTTTVGTLVGPLKTYDEIARRVGALWALRQNTTVTQVGNYAGTCNFVVNPNTHRLILQGALPAFSFSGVLSAVTALAAATKTLAKATSTWTVATEQRARIVRNVTKGAWAWVYADNGGGNATVSPWTTVDLVTGINQTIVDAAINDAVETYALPTLGSLQLFVVGTGNLTAGPTNPAPVIVQQLDVTGTNGRSRINSSGGQVQVQNCRFSVNLMRFEGGFFQLTNDCSIVGASFGNDVPGVGTFASGIWGGATITATVSSTVSAFNYPIFFATVSLTLGCTSQLQGASFSDVAGACVILNRGGLLHLNVAISFSVNCGAGIDMSGFGRLTVLASLVSTMGITGTAGDLRIEDGAGNLQTTALPFDTTTRLYLAARTLSWANLAATVATTGFGGLVQDPSRSASIAAIL